MVKEIVKLVSWLQNPSLSWDAEDSASCGARGCQEEKSSFQIHEEEIAGILNAKNDKEKKEAKEKYETRKEQIFKETSGRGHGAVLDPSCFNFSIENLSRASTLFLCAPEYASHLQQSLRFVTSKKGFYLPENLENTLASELMEKQFNLYSQMQEEKIPSEDARFILPLYTKTNIQSTLDARELMHLYSMSKQKNVPEEIKGIINQMIEQTKNIAPRLMKDREKNYEALSFFPSSQIFSKENLSIDYLIKANPGKKLLTYSILEIPESIIDLAIKNRNEAELTTLKHFHFEFLIPMSLACFHQATRQRTWNQSVQCLESAVKIGKFVTPPTIKKSIYNEEYQKLNKESIDFVHKNLDNKEVLGILPHSLQVYDLIHINGWNAIHSIGKRTCTKAQWEIRNIAKEMSKEIRKYAPELGKYSVPQGILYGSCPEKKSCGLCDKILERQK